MWHTGLIDFPKKAEQWLTNDLTSSWALVDGLTYCSYLLGYHKSDTHDS